MNAAERTLLMMVAAGLEKGQLNPAEATCCACVKAMPLPTGKVPGVLVIEGRPVICLANCSKCGAKNVNCCYMTLDHPSMVD